MTFQDIQQQLRALTVQQQELQSATYVIVPIGEHKLIAYYDLEEETMGYSVANEAMIEVKLLAELPVEVLIEFGKFVEKIELWTENKIEFPYAMQTARAADFQDLLRNPLDFQQPDDNHDGDEGKIE